MADFKRQVLIRSPVEEVWELIGNPNRHPEWFPMVVEVTGLGTVERDATYCQTTRAVGGKSSSIFRIETLDDLREIRVRCTDTGTYVRFLLTPARDDTFTEIHIGFEPTSFLVRAVDVTVGQRYCKRWTDEAVDGLQSAVSRLSAAAAR